MEAFYTLRFLKTRGDRLKVSRAQLLSLAKNVRFFACWVPSVICFLTSTEVGWKQL